MDDGSFKAEILLWIVRNSNFSSSIDSRFFMSFRYEWFLIIYRKIISYNKIKLHNIKFQVFNALLLGIKNSSFPVERFLVPSKSLHFGLKPDVRVNFKPFRDILHVLENFRLWGKGIGPI